jgi:hypothetical protein
MVQNISTLSENRIPDSPRVQVGLRQTPEEIDLSLSYCPVTEQVKSLKAEKYTNMSPCLIIRTEVRQVPGSNLCHPFFFFFLNKLPVSFQTLTSLTYLIVLCHLTIFILCSRNTFFWQFVPNSTNIKRCYKKNDKAKKEKLYLKTAYNFVTPGGREAVSGSARQ